MYGLVGVVYGHGVGETPVAPDVPVRPVPMLAGSIVPVPAIPAATDDADVLKQLIEFWWWLVETIDVPSGFTVHGNVFAPSGDGTFAQLFIGSFHCAPNVKQTKQPALEELDRFSHRLVRVPKS
uniref:Uncharacterized protein n=1 Tax=Anopheles farauti TaxID=69004 RepID=A0A182QQB8_9DIPT